MTRVQNTLTTRLNLPAMDLKNHGVIFEAVDLEPGEADLETARIQAIRALPETHGLRVGWENLVRGHRGRQPQLIVFTPVESEAKVGKPSGPPPPETLEIYKDEKVALALIDVTDDRDALTRWSEDSRKPVAKAAAKKLASLA
jgi:hypothetical protein